ncbi:uncharacterized protein [Onthophagus taurus]|uniref:uncharacterized protein n=1 Tax=Onthophagus taurus TaxID=166361 RepID=UPI0039BDE391
MLEPKRVYESYRVCHRHFTKADKTSNMYLRKNCVPSLFLPGPRVSVPVPSPAPQIDEATSASLDALNGVTPPKIMRFSTPICSSSKESRPNPIPHNNPVPARAKKLRRMIMTTQEKILRCSTKQLRRNLAVSRFRNRNFKVRLRQAQLALKNVPLRKMAHLNKNVVLFCEMQLRISRNRAKGRRFSDDEKLLCLSIYKQSGRCYRYLSKLFNLPCKNIFVAMSTRLKCQAGINESLFKNIKTIVEKFSNKDKICLLMFDEVKLTPHLDYNGKVDCIYGFEDYGELKSNKFGEYALVFELQGVARKWIQPVAYILSGGPAKSIKIANLITQVIGKAKTSGLSSCLNQAAVNHLIGKNAEKVINIDGDVIIPIFDLPPTPPN